MHFIATYRFIFNDSAEYTSEKAPDPFIRINLYSIKVMKN